MPPPTTQLADTPTITVNGAPLPTSDADAIVDLRVSTALDVPNELQLRLADEGFELLDGTRYEVGTEITVDFPFAGDPVRVFKGEIVSVGVELREETLTPLLTVIALDVSHRLRNATKVRTFQNMKYSDVVRQIAQESGMQADVDDTKVKFDYLIQTTTNYDFLQEIAFRTGLEWRVEEKKLIMRERTRTVAATVKYGRELRSMRARFSAAGQATDVHVRAWNPATKGPIDGHATIRQAHLEAGGDSDNQLASRARPKAKALGAGTLHAGALVATSSDEATQLSKSLAARVAGADLEVRCECLGHPRIVAGATVKIEGAGRKLAGNYYVTSAEHTFGSDRGYLTTFSTGPRDSSSMVDLFTGSQSRVTPFGQLGLAIGIVTNNKDPNGVGRVRVKFPTLSDSDESWWAPVITAGASSSAGLMIIPQIGDEVLVGFEHGDLRRPFVLGGVWGEKAKPPNTTDRFLAQNKVIDWGLRTANGSTFNVRSGSAPADKHFKFALPDGTTLYLGSDKTEVIAQNKSITLKSGPASITITDKGDIEIKGMNIKINATQGVTVDGLTIAAKAKTEAKIEGSVAVELKGGASAKLEAAGVAEVKGAMVKIN